MESPAWIFAFECDLCVKTHDDCGICPFWCHEVLKQHPTTQQLCELERFLGTVVFPGHNIWGELNSFLLYVFSQTKWTRFFPMGAQQHTIVNSPVHAVWMRMSEHLHQYIQTYLRKIEGAYEPNIRLSPEVETLIYDYWVAMIQRQLRNNQQVQRVRRVS